MRRCLLSSLFILFFSLASVACGQKGPLVLPDEQGSSEKNNEKSLEKERL